MDDPEAVARLGDALGHPLRDELAGMDADDRKAVGEPLLQIPYTREYMHAVDSTVGPEVEQHHATPQVCEAHGSFSSDPIEAVPELGRVDRAGPYRDHGAPCDRYVGRSATAVGI
jgi:hypothetical protein